MIPGAGAGAGAGPSDRKREKSRSNADVDNSSKRLKLDDERNINNIEVDDLAALMSSLEKVYQSCVVMNNDNNEEDDIRYSLDQLLYWDERGAVMTVVWPFLVVCHNYNKDKNNDNDTSSSWLHGCHLLALLVSIHCREGTFPSSSALPFLHQNYHHHHHHHHHHHKHNIYVFGKVLKTLFEYGNKISTTGANHYNTSTDDDTTTSNSSTLDKDCYYSFQCLVVHLLIVSFACCGDDDDDDDDKVQKEKNDMRFLYDCIGMNLQLWNHIPKRRRLLELKQQAVSIRKQFHNMNDATNHHHNNKSSAKPFLVTIVQHLLQLLSSEQQQQRSFTEMNNSIHWTFIHRSFEFIIDLLSNTDVQTRQYLVTYLDSIHFIVYCKTSFVINNHETLTNQQEQPIRLAQQLLQRIYQYMTLLPPVPIQTTTTTTTTKSISTTTNNTEIISLYHQRARILQKLCYRHYPNLQNVIYAGHALLCHNPNNNNISPQSSSATTTNKEENGYLRRAMGALKDGQLYDLLYRLRLIENNNNNNNNNNINTNNSNNTTQESRKGQERFLWQLLYQYLTIPLNPLDRLKSFPLYPTETILWDHNLIPPSSHNLNNVFEYQTRRKRQSKTRTNQTSSSSSSNSISINTANTILSLPKLNKQFLSFQDYLLRNFELIRLESAYEIRSDLVDVIRRLRPVVRQEQVDNDYDTNSNGDLSSVYQKTKTEFTGWARMALELQQPDAAAGGYVTIQKVHHPNLGETLPSQVIAEFTIDLGPCGDTIRNEWDEITEFDNLFLVAIDANQMTGDLAPLWKDYYYDHGINSTSNKDTEEDKREKDNKNTDENEENNISNESNRRIQDEEDPTFPERFGITDVRGCMVLQVRDESGTVLSDPYNTNVHNNKIAPSSAKDNNKKNNGDDQVYKPTSTKRIYRVALDPAQYSIDYKSSNGTKVYERLNLVVRRHGRENNFKAVLETIRGLMDGIGSIHRVIPLWLQYLLLGSDKNNVAHYKSLMMKTYAQQTVGVPNPDSFLDFGDTFLNEQHLRTSFLTSTTTNNEISSNSSSSDVSIVVDGRKEQEQQDGSNDDHRKNYKVRIVEKDANETLVIAESYSFNNRQDGTQQQQQLQNKRGNTVRFTPNQVEAIRSGLSPGLTVIVGPPGTGKTDVAVQIISNLYTTFPHQRTIIITHSNAALNDIFQKVMERGDIHERYLVRLGAGERSLSTSSKHDFTKMGRVQYSLEQRMVLLEQVQKLSESIGTSNLSDRGPDGAPSYTCETADYFYRHSIARKIRQFEKKYSSMAQQQGSTSSNEHNNNNNNTVDVKSIFPFGKYFAIDSSTDSNNTVIANTTSNNVNNNTDTLTAIHARELFTQIQDIFAELAEYRPLELLRTQRQRSDYLIMKQARVVAMTCTHAAIARSYLIELGFEYDNVIMEEAGQMLEIETFIPLLLQRGGKSSSISTTDGEEEYEKESSTSTSKSSAVSRLKRVCLMGDHNQLPPVVKNNSFSKFSNLDQSLFSRLIRLGVPYVQLDKQGRSRPEIARLYSWRYKELGNLEHVIDGEEFQFANAGFAHTHQVINVENFQGRGESTPTAYFYQNVGEAEYAVALFQYMVLIGYSPQKISILTTYNGQKALIQDILRTRCGHNTPFGGTVQPRTVSTVDQYQGQQNDIILLSLVRTETVGHLRDIRRLVVAVSRARHGLYVFCRQSVFARCHELKRTFDQFITSNRSSKLQLVLGENYPTDRKVVDEISRDNLFEIEDLTHLGSIVHSMQDKLLI